MNASRSFTTFVSIQRILEVLVCWTFVCPSISLTWWSGQPASSSRDPGRCETCDASHRGDRLSGHPQGSTRVWLTRLALSRRRWVVLFLRFSGATVFDT
jgi:hypothetical protein